MGEASQPSIELGLGGPAGVMVVGTLLPSHSEHAPVTRLVRPAIGVGIGVRVGVRVSVGIVDAVEVKNVGTVDGLELVIVD